ncbi:Erythritol/L-threitol dehydrogenase [Neomoorella glycerini]|uniref:Erythritol/L-threitol dehydrogenase n=1 Tax=Neomoorella glycerini TaxID=55779 RepID=A0A6I5ZUG9_9FIRM|nr:zinc-dependent dehydrogenase [Moorella glycerini]QGP93692.1 Erythritol/L-threitol dehydrogenase [Moorella glycerini]
MLAAVLHGPNDLRVEHVNDPIIGAGELLVKVEACAICGTDLRIVKGTKTRGVHYPSIIGHEFAGTVVDVGEGVTNFAPGDHVAVAPIIPCRNCAYCVNGQENVCLNRVAIGYEFNGGFAELVCIPAVVLDAGNIVKIDPGVPLEAAALAEPLSCCLNGQRKARVRLNSNVVIIGAGPIGLMHIMLARAAGAAQIIVSELLPNRRERALAAGADVVIDPGRENLLEIVKNCTNGLGADIVILAIGVPALVNDTLRLLRKGGHLNFFAGMPEGATSSIDANLIHYNELRLSGTSASTRQDFYEALNLIVTGKIAASSLISHRFPLREADQAFAVAFAGEGEKVVIYPSQSGR